MPVINRDAVVPHSAAQMFELVNDVNRYSEFLPWCNQSSVLYRGDDEIKAEIGLALGSMTKSFTTLNRLQKDKMIEMRLVDGPFNHLEGFWRFETLDKHTKVSLDLEYEFANKLISFAVGPAFSKIANSLVDAFCVRANTVYADAD